MAKFVKTFNVFLNAAIYNMEVNKSMKDKIFVALNKQKEKYGEYYCPCSPIRNEDTICPCKNMRENKDCHCKLYVRR